MLMGTVTVGPPMVRVIVGTASVDALRLTAEEEQTAQIEGLGKTVEALVTVDHIRLKVITFAGTLNESPSALLSYGDEWSGDRRDRWHQFWLSPATKKRWSLQVARVESAGIDVAGIEEAGVASPGL